MFIVLPLAMMQRLVRPCFRLTPFSKTPLPTTARFYCKEKVCYTGVGGEKAVSPNFKNVMRPDAGAPGATEERQNFSYFMFGVSGLTLAVGAGEAVKRALLTMNPADDVLAMANVEVDLSAIEEGKSITLKWRGKPLFVRHRNAEEINNAVSADSETLRDQQSDSERVLNPKYLIVLGICTHLGCVPISNSGDYNGYFCPCHGSHYDTSGRIRRGPAPLNLEVPPYKFLTDDLVLVGESE